jgi:hypothetical protein
MPCPIAGFFVCGMMGRFVYMKNKILKARRWLQERTLFEKVIIHIGLFPLPVLFILISYSINNLNDN